MNSKPIGVDCPDCPGGRLVELVSKRGRVFYGCNRFPHCRFVSWTRPVDDACPECGSIYLVEKRYRSTVRRHCPNEGCGFKKPVRSAAPPVPTQGQKAG